MATNVAGAEDRSTSRHGTFVLLAILVVLMAGILAPGYFYYRGYERRYRTEVEQQLSAIADLKVAGLVNWRQERLADATLLFENKAFTTLVSRCSNDPADSEAQTSLRTWLEQLQRHFLYEQVLLLDAEGAACMVVPNTSDPPPAHLLRDSAEAMRSRQITILDFHRDAPDSPIHLAVLTPILDERNADKPLGAVVLRINPGIYLYPFIRRWPTPSRTAETLLVRRDGDSVLFLDDLRFRKNTALSYREPLTRKDMPAVKAVLGQEGIVEGVDYRGVPVIAALRAIPDSPWFLVARMDSAEVYGPLMERFYLTIAFVGVLILAAAACVGLLWRQQRASFYKEKARGRHGALRTSEAQYRRLFEAARDGILILDVETGMVIDANPFMTELLGISHEEFLATKVWELGFFRDIAANQAKFLELQQKGYVRYSGLPLETVEGRRINVEFVSNVYPVNSHQVIQCNIRDTTIQVQLEEAMKSKTALPEAETETSIDGILAVDEHGKAILCNTRFGEIWNIPREVCNAKDDKRMLHHVLGQLSDPDEFLDKVRYLYGHKEVRSRDEILLKDGRTLDRYSSPLPDAQGKCTGRIWFFRDITDRKQAETAMRRSEDRYRAMFNALNDGFCTIEVIFDADSRPIDYRFLEVNPAFESLTGLRDVQGKRMRSLKPGHEEHWFEMYGKVVLTGEPVHLVHESKTLNRWYSISACRIGGPGSHNVAVLLSDITDRKRDEEQHGTILKSAMDGFFVIDNQGRFQEVNDSLCEMTGYTVEELLKMSITDLEAKETPQETAAHIRRVQTARKDRFETQHRRKDGRIVDVEISVRCSGNRSDRYFCFAHDITDRKQREADLRASEAELRAMFEVAAIGISQADAKTGRFLRVNAKMCDITGYSADELLAMRVADITHPDDRDTDEKAFQRVVCGETPDYHREKRYIRKDGSPVWVNVNMTVVMDATHRPLRTIATIEDITARRQSEESLRQSEERHRLLVASLTDYIYTVTVTDGHVVETVHGPGCLTLTGYSPEEFQADGQLWLNVVPEEDRPAVLDQAQSLAAGRKVASLEHRIVHKDGSTRWVRNTSVLRFDSQGKFVGYEGLIQSITEQRTLLEQLVQAQKMEAVGLLAGGIAHDFRNQLTVIKGYGEMLVRRGMVEDKALEYVQQILRAADRSTELSGQLLAFSRQQELRPTVVNLDNVIAGLSNSLSRMVGEDVRLSVVPGKGLGNVKVDAAQFQQALMNLVVNARDAMPKGGDLTIKTADFDMDEAFARQHPGSVPGPYVMMTVTDTGVGMDKETLRHMFEPFYTTKPAGQGTGLGLAMVYGLVKQSGGYIAVRGEPGRGATFTIYLPRVQEKLDTVVHAEQVEPLSGGTGTILVVEDEQAIRNIVVVTLRECGYTVLEASGARDALPLGKHYDGQIDLLISDVVMPGMSGPEIAEKLLPVRPRMTVLYISGYTGKALANQGVVPADVNLLTKPFTPHVLAETVRKLLGEKT